MKSVKGGLTVKFYSGLFVKRRGSYLRHILLFSDDFPGAEEELFQPKEPVLQALHFLHARVVYSFYQRVHFRLEVLSHRFRELEQQREKVKIFTASVIREYVR